MTTTLREVRVTLLQRQDEIEAFTKWLVLQKPERVLEIGSHQGGTALLWCQRAPTLVISVDLPGGAGGGLSMEDCRARNAMIGSQYPQFQGILADSHDPRTVDAVRQVLDGELLDLLFIDGDHGYDGVKQDFHEYSRFVKSGGFVAFHDINDTPTHREQGCFVHEFWQELIRQRDGSRMWEFNAHGIWGGIGVIQV